MEQFTSGSGSADRSPATPAPGVRGPRVATGDVVRGARLVVIALLSLAALLPWRARPGVTIPGGGGSDQALHTATLARLHAGDAYYTAVGEELRRRQFPTASPFNWRTPLFFSILSVNLQAARIAFVALGLLVLACTVRALARSSVLVVLTGAIAQAGAIMVIFDPEVWVFHEVWTGCLIAVSLFAYAANRSTAGAVLGLFALFVRELAAPYALLCAVFAVRERRRREIQLWGAGFALYAVYYAWHVWAVLHHQQSAEPAHAAGWLQFGGLSFVVDTFRTNSLLHTAPVWAASAALLVVAAGLLARSIPVRTRATAGLYLAFFAAVGQQFNWYWGWLAGFVLPLVFAHGLATLRAIVVGAAAVGDRASVVSGSTALARRS
jgi:hypothetical protein